ncbi:MAG: xanthine dehydrogenase family protein molybdopterin-binding subunit, partial [Rhizobiales bacterium]|nr:xanthine dehydrogenase family protein molybdopterin-binding subunit [Hyphomicrobiales bacterium]
MNDTAPMKFGMGARPRRKEDKTLVTGTGRFTDDYAPPGCLRAYVVRSSMAHARIKLGDLAAARAMPGVALIMTAADIEGVNGLPCKIKLLQIDGTYQKNPKHPLLCGDMVRHVGDPIA